MLGRSEGTIEWLCDEFMASGRWRGFKPHTRYQWTKYKNNI